MKHIDVSLRSADAHNFAPYGSYVPYPSPASQEPAERPGTEGPYWAWYGRLLRERFGSDISFGMYVTAPIDANSAEPAPYRTGRFERHRHTPEIWIPLDGELVVLLAQAGAIVQPFYPEHREGRADAVAKDRFAAFRIPTGQAVVLAPGVWHAVPFARTETRVLVMYRDGTAAEDCESVDLHEVDVEVTASR
jgi:ureidoglycolate hydrolase